MTRHHRARAAAATAAALLAFAGCGGTASEDPPPGTVAVPDVTGQSAAFAGDRLRAVGLAAGDVPDQRAARRLVAAQDPPAGGWARPGARVALRTVKPLAARVAGRAPLAFDRVQAVGERALRVRVLAPRCCPPERPAVQVVGRTVRLRLSSAAALAQGARIAPRWVEVRLPEPLAGRAVVPADAELARPVPTRAVRPAAPGGPPIVMADDRTVAVPYTGGIPACFALHAVVVRETPSEVRVGVRTGTPRRQRANLACGAIAIRSVALARLKAPLADRRLVAVVP